jgi:quercetin dioxygenase-like cupin family protein
VAAWTEAGEHHWHGAGRDEPMSHIAVQTATPGGDGATWLEAVSASEWAAALL